MKILLYDSRSSNEEGKAGHQEQVDKYSTLIIVLVRTEFVQHCDCLLPIIVDLRIRSLENEVFNGGRT